MSDPNPSGSPYEPTQAGQPAYGYPQTPPPPAGPTPPPGYGYPQGSDPYAKAPDPGAPPVGGNPYAVPQPPAPPAGWGASGPATGGYLTPGAAPTLVTIGDIAVTGDGIITPVGQLPLRGAAWTVTDMSRTEEKIPAYAIVLAIVFALACLFGLFFLLIKEKRTTGYVQVTVSGGGRYHATMIPVSHPGAVTGIMQQVNYARSLSA
jgi:hypothetical protein